MRSWRKAAVLLALVLLLVEASLLALTTGPARLPAGQALRILVSPLPGLHGLAAEATEQERNIVLQVRAPRLALALLVGAVLALAGVIMQAIFQNPMAEPSILGISAGGALGATAAIVLGFDFTLGALSSRPVSAFVGSTGVALVVYLLARRGGRTPVGLLLLTGIAVGSLCSSLASLLLVRGNDGQVTDVVFWMLGSVSYQGWAEVQMVLPYALVGSVVAFAHARDLNALLLGDEQAAYLGIAVERVKFLLLGCGALLAAAGVAAAGIVGFVGLVVPHVMRLVVGPDHRILLPTSLLGGGLAVIVAALVADALGAVPLGIITALLGAPFFLYLLHRERGYHF